MIIEIPYKPRELQKQFHDNIKRWNVIVTHRRFGKTVMVVNQLIRDCLCDKKLNPKYAYISPYLVQTRQIAWDYVKHYSQDIPGVKFNEAELKVTYPNGGTVQLLGGDNPHRLRGIYLDGVALDEYAQIRPSLFTEIISPALTDRKGYAIFLGTPMGKNHFYDIYKIAESNKDWYSVIHKATDTGYVPEEELERSRQIMSPDEFEQEFQCSWEAAIKGAYFTEEIKRARDENRICESVYNKDLEVHTAWDIGISDDTAITFYQIHGKEIRIVDFYQNNGLALPEYISMLKDKPYKYGKHFMPWDSRIRAMSSGKSTLDVAKEYGMEAKVVPNVSVQDGIQQLRMTLQRCWFEKEKTKDLIEMLTQYRREFDEKRMVFRPYPLHDYTSHGVDSMRYMALSLKEAQPGANAYEQAAKDFLFKNTENYAKLSLDDKIKTFIHG